MPIAQQFRRTFAPEAMPGACFICRSSNREWFIDVGLSEDFFGAIYLCNECLSEMAHMVGWYTDAQLEEAEEKSAKLSDRLLQLEIENKGLQDGLDALAHARLFPRRDGGDSKTDPRQSEDAIFGTHEEVREPLELDEVGESGTSEQDSSGQPDSVRPSPDSDEFDLGI